MAEDPATYRRLASRIAIDKKIQEDPGTIRMIKAAYNSEYAANAAKQDQEKMVKLKELRTKFEKAPGLNHPPGYTFYSPVTLVDIAYTQYGPLALCLTNDGEKFTTFIPKEFAEEKLIPGCYVAVRGEVKNSERLVGIKNFKVTEVPPTNPQITATNQSFNAGTPAKGAQVEDSGCMIADLGLWPDLLKKAA